MQCADDDKDDVQCALMMIRTACIVKCEMCSGVLLTIRRVSSLKCEVCYVKCSVCPAGDKEGVGRAVAVIIHVSQRSLIFPVQ